MQARCAELFGSEHARDEGCGRPQPVAVVGNGRRPVCSTAVAAVGPGTGDSRIGVSPANELRRGRAADEEGAWRRREAKATWLTGRRAMRP